MFVSIPRFSICVTGGASVKTHPVAHALRRLHQPGEDRFPLRVGGLQTLVVGLHHAVAEIPDLLQNGQEQVPVDGAVAGDQMEIAAAVWIVLVLVLTSQIRITSGISR